MTDSCSRSAARCPRRPRGDRPARAVRLHGDSRCACGRPIYPRQILRQMIEIGYYSLPVVGLTAIFTGMVLALQSYTGFSRFNAESRDPHRRRAVAHARARPGAGRPDGRRPRRRLDGGRDRHHARHRADRRAHHALDQPVQVSGRAAADRRHSSRCRCWCWSPTSSASSAAISSASTSSASTRPPISSNTVDFLEPMDVVSGLVKAAVFGFIVALMGCYHGYQFQGRRAGRRRGDHQRGGLGLDPDPDLQLHPHRAVLLAMSETDGPRSRSAGLNKSFGPKQVLNGIDLDVGDRRIAGRDRRLRHRQVGAAQMHPRPHAARRRARSRSTARRRVGLTGARARARSLRKFGMLFQGCGAVRLAAGLGERRLRPDPGPRHGPRRGQGDRPATSSARSASGPRSASSIRPSCRAACRSAWRSPAPSPREPEIIFFDEPTTGLDPIMADVINDLIVEMRRATSAPPRSRSPTTWPAPARSPTASP